MKDRNILNKINIGTFAIERTAVYLSVTIFIGLTLRLSNLTKFGLWFDEAIDLYSAMAFKSIFPLSLDLSAGRLFLFLLKGWMNISSSDYFLRLFPVICGILSVIMIYRIGEFLFSRTIGIISALFLSISPMHIYYSQELTAYSFSALLALSSSYFFLKFLGNPSRRLSILYLITTLGLIYSHATNLIFILGQNMFFYLFYYKDLHLRRKWVCLQLMVLFLSLPCLRITMLRLSGLPQLKTMFYWIERPNVGMLLQTFMVFSLGYNAPWWMQFTALIIFLFFSLRAVFSWYKKNGFFYLIIWLLVPIGLVWLISQFHHFYLHRIFFFALPALYLLTAAGMTKIKKYLAAGLVIPYLILAAYSLNNYYQNKWPIDYKKRYLGVKPKKDYRGAAVYVERNFHKGDIILHICRSSFMPFVYYHQNKIPEFGIKLNDIYRTDWILSWNHILQLSGSPKIIKILTVKDKDSLSSYKNIWLVHSDWDSWGKTDLTGYDEIGKTIVDWFDVNFLREQVQFFEGINIYLFSNREAH